MTATEINNTEHIKYPDSEPHAVKPNKKTTQLRLAPKSSADSRTQEQSQHLNSFSSEAHGASRPTEYHHSFSKEEERDKRMAQLTDELALKSSLLEQVMANAAEEKRRAGLELREYKKRIHAQISLIKQRDAELVDMQFKLRNTEGKLDELLLYCDQQIG